MKNTIQTLQKNTIQVLLFLFVNSLFVLKYLPRAEANPIASLAVYLIFISVVLVTFYSFSDKVSEKTYKVVFWVLLLVMILAIIGFLIAIDPYHVRVDRWSALAFFWDNAFKGIYPYSAHTHTSLTNYPSPFPLWHVLNLPFYLFGDVGIGLIFFLILVALSVQHFFSSYKISFLFLLLLCISPAYWWEVAVRSDSLNNAFLVFAIVLWLNEKGRTLSNSFIIIAVLCGLIATTRLTAILPMALLFFKPYIQLPWKQKILFPLIVFGVFFLIFSPFIFWDTNTWIFFSRNPFMSQADKGNIYIFLSMIILGVIMAYKWKNFNQFLGTASLFIFIFILVSQIGLIYATKTSSDLLSDHICDISYFSLMLPYCIAIMALNFKTNNPKYKFNK